MYQELDAELAFASVEKAKQRFSIKVRKMEEMRLRFTHAKDQLKIKQEKDKAERRRGMIDKRRAEVALTLGGSY